MDMPAHLQKAPLVRLQTNDLRQRLNRIYDTVRGNSHSHSVFSRFDYLWDLKELAVLEGRAAVEVPESWLEELERLYIECGQIRGRHH
jgi:hypothetical protein